MPSNKDDIFGGMFDFDGDGKTDIGEEFLAYMMFEEMTKDDKKSKTDDSIDFDGFDELDEDLNEDDLDENSDESDEMFGSDFSSSEYASTPAASSGYRPAPIQKIEYPIKDVSNTVKAIPTEMTLDGYKAVRKQFLKDCALSVVIGLVMCFLPALVIWAAFKSYDEKNSASGFIIALVLIVGVVVVGAIIKAIASQVSPSWTSLKLAKTAYSNSAPQEELNAQKSKKRKTTIIVCVCIGLAFASVITLSILNSVHLSSVYENAEHLIESGEYLKARDNLKDIEDKNYKDTSALILLCTAHIEYDGGRYVDAYYTLKDASFRYQTSSQQSKISSFRNTLDAEYKAYIKRMSERQQQEYENKIVNGVPYVGMSESRIADTTLGKPSDKVRHNSEMINGQRYTANLYDFYQNGKRIFTARCIQGRVTEVWDERNSTTSTYTPRSGKTSTDPSVEGFSHPEDFYEYYWDDFFDYEDAEDYYYEHGGK